MHTVSNIKIYGMCVVSGLSRRSGDLGSYTGWARCQQSVVVIEWWQHGGSKKGRHPYNDNKEQNKICAVVVLCTASKSRWTREHEIFKTKNKETQSVNVYKYTLLKNSTYVNERLILWSLVSKSCFYSTAASSSLFVDGYQFCASGFFFKPYVV